MKTLQLIQRDGFQPLLDRSIILNEHADGRIILNYSQLNSPKEDEIVRECRSLTVTKQGELVARSFPRFFNTGEALAITKKFRWDMPVTAFDKIDGSLIKIFYWDGWKIQTRNSFADAIINGAPYTWADVVNSKLKTFYECDLRSYTFICELTSPYNVVVQQHTKVDLWLLAAFQGTVELHDDIVDELAKETGLNRPARHIFYDLMDAQYYIAGEARKYSGFEGVVLKDVDGMRLKVKSDKYVALHRLFDNGNVLLDKNVIPLIIDGEVDEVAAYFPLLRERADELQARINIHMDEVNRYWHCFHDIESRKKFAQAVDKCKWKYLLFAAYNKGGKPADYLTADFVIKFL